MNNLKTYEEFNWKKGLAGVAMMGALAGAPSCTSDRIQFDGTESEYVEKMGLNPKIIAYMTDNYINWERFCLTDSNMTPNRHKKYSLKNYMMKKLKEKFTTPIINNNSTNPRLWSGGIPDELRSNFDKYWNYYEEFLKSEPSEYEDYYVSDANKILSNKLYSDVVTAIKDNQIQAARDLISTSNEDNELYNFIRNNKIQAARNYIKYKNL